MKKELRESNVQDEIDHRINNNLNMISSMLGLQILNLKNGSSESVEDILLKSKLRIEALAMVHNALDRGADSIEVDFTKYINNLNLLLTRTYQRKIPIRVDANTISLNTNTMLKLGFILNELFTNSFQHAFPQQDVKGVVISLTRHKDQYFFTYHEDGGKLVNIKKIRQSKKLGIKLIDLVLKEMKATMTIFQKNGLTFQIRFIPI